MRENIVEFSHLIHSLEAFEDCSRRFDDGVLLYQYLSSSSIDRHSLGVNFIQHKKRMQIALGPSKMKTDLVLCVGSFKIKTDLVLN